MSSTNLLSTWAARSVIVVAVLIVGWLLAAILSYFLRHSPLSIAVDRLLGMFFGVVRGAVVIAAVVLLRAVRASRRHEVVEKFNFAAICGGVRQLDTGVCRNGHGSAGASGAARARAAVIDGERLT